MKTKFLLMILTIVCTPVVPVLGEPEGIDSTGKMVPWDQSVPVKDLQQIIEEGTNYESKKEVQRTESKTHPSAPDLSDLPKKGNVQETGLVIARQTKEPIAGAQVSFTNEEHEFSTKTDADGFYKIYKAKPGIYQLKVYKQGYALFEKSEVKVGQGSPSLREVALDNRILKGQLVEVTPPASAGSMAAQLAKRKQSSGVMETMGAEQISKGTDSDAASIAKRVTGTSTVGGKFIFVRGLGERYTNMTLNGLPVPSPEKEKRVVPQDLFPASALESFTIHKTVNAGLPADFAGGSVALVTKGIPEKDFMKLSVGTSDKEFVGDGRFLTMGGDRLKSDNSYDGPLHYFGFVNNDLKIPDGVPGKINKGTYTSERIAGFSSKFHNNVGPDTGLLIPGHSFGFSMGRINDEDKYSRSGYMADFSFSNGFENIEATKTIVSEGVLNDSFVVRPAIGQSTVEGSYETRMTGMVNWGMEDYNNKLWFKSLYAKLSEDKTLYRRSEKIPPANITQEFNVEERFDLLYQQRYIAVAQLGGGHFLGISLLDSLSWATGAAFTEGNSPDNRKYYYYRNSDGNLAYDDKGAWGTRQWEKTQEFGLNGRTDLDLVIPPSVSPDTMFLREFPVINKVKLPKGKAGLFSFWRKRSYDITRYSWEGISEETQILKAGDKADSVASLVSPNNNYDLVESVLHPDNTSYIIENSRNGFRTTPKDFDTYNANEISASLYADLDLDFKIFSIPSHIYSGVRGEYFHLNFVAPFTGDQRTNTEGNNEKTILRNDILWYPSNGLSFEFFPSTKTHFHFARTVVRPEMRERAPTRFWDSEEEREVEGNIDLRDTKIWHYDARFDWYLPFNQIVSMSVFYKQFTDPVETVIDASNNPNIQKFQNAQGAFVRGVEFEADWNIGETFRETPANPVTRGLGLYMNTAFMQSEIQLDFTDPSIALLTSRERPMMGQSPFLLNLKFTQERKLGKVEMLNSLLYNLTGDRITGLGTQGIPDEVESPPIDLSYLGKITYQSHSLNVKLKNLLASKRIVFAETPGKNIIDSEGGRSDRFRLETEAKGIEVSLGYSITF